MSSKDVWVPHPYQKRGLELTTRQSAAGLFLDPGLGKTSISLATFKILKAAEYVERALVIAPLKPLYDVWPEETEKWANFSGITMAMLHGPDKDWQASHPEGVDIFLINPEGLQWLFKDLKRFRKMSIDMLIVDESTKFKHPNTARFKLLKNHLKYFKRRYILTGTLVPNGLMDLFGQVYLLDYGNALGGYITHYRMKYFTQPNPVYEPYRWEPNEDAFDRIAEKLSPMCLQLNAEDHIKMPDIMFTNINVTLPPEAMELYRQVDDEFVSVWGEDVVLAANSAVAGTKCRQIANGAVYREDGEWIHVHDAKIEALKELVEELSGAPLLVLYEYRHDLERLLKAFPNAPHVGGGVSQKKASQAIKDFSAGRVPLLFGHPQSMGHGLNLQGGCRHVCWFGITWNYEFYDQAIRRVYRQGQKAKTVMVYHIVARNTRDERVLYTLADKEAVQTRLEKALIAPV